MGKVKSFTTPAMQAVVTTGDVQFFSGNDIESAIVTFDVKPVNVAKDELISGICVSTHPEPTLLDSHSGTYGISGKTTFHLVHPYIDFNPNTTYYYRAFTCHANDYYSDYYSKNPCGVIYGEVKSVTSPGQ